MRIISEKWMRRIRVVLKQGGNSLYASFTVSSYYSPFNYLLVYGIFQKISVDKRLEEIIAYHIRNCIPKILLEVEKNILKVQVFSATQ